MSEAMPGWLVDGALMVTLLALLSCRHPFRRRLAALGGALRVDLAWLTMTRDNSTRNGEEDLEDLEDLMEHEPTELAREATERRTLAALRALWPTGGGALTSTALADHLAASGSVVPARDLRLLLESFQMRGWLRLTRGAPEFAAREAHGPRTITWVNAALLD